MPTLPTPRSLRTIESAWFNAYTGLLLGTAGYGQLVRFNDLSDATNYANIFGNQDSTNGRAVHITYGTTASAVTIAQFTKTGVTLKQLSASAVPASGLTTIYAGDDGRFYIYPAGGSATRMATYAEASISTGGQAQVAVGSTSGPSTTSSSYATITDMSRAITTTGGKLLCYFTGPYANTSLTQENYCAFSLDGAAEVGIQSFTTPVANFGVNMTNIHLFTSVSAAAHTVTVRWKTTGGTLSSSGTARELIVHEIAA